jgi:hypothetical protein
VSPASKRAGQPGQRTSHRGLSSRARPSARSPPSAKLRACSEMPQRAFSSLLIGTTAATAVPKPSAAPSPRLSRACCERGTGRAVADGEGTARVGRGTTPMGSSPAIVIAVTVIEGQGFLQGDGQCEEGRHGGLPLPTEAPSTDFAVATGILRFTAASNSLVDRSGGDDPTRPPVTPSPGSSPARTRCGSETPGATRA